MKNALISLFLILSVLSAPSLRADGDHAAPKKEAKFSETSAVSAFDPEAGFQLKEAALSSLGVRFQALNDALVWQVPQAALVRIKHVTGVYRRAEGWISFVLVEAQGRSAGSVTIRSEDLQAGDEIAVEGAPFLRMTEADLNADTVDSCSH